MDRHPASKASAKQHRLAAAMAEVHANIPSSVKAAGKKGKAKEAMLAAIAYSKSRKR